MFQREPEQKALPGKPPAPRSSSPHQILQNTASNGVSPGDTPTPAKPQLFSDMWQLSSYIISWWTTLSAHSIDERAKVIPPQAPPKNSTEVTQKGFR